MTTRIGHKMLAAVEVVRASGGKNVPNRDVCHAVSPHPIPSRNESYGYEIVNRAVKAGLLVRTPVKNGSVLSLPPDPDAHGSDEVHS